MEIKEKKRTIQQNKALHLYFEMVAEALNEAGLDMKKVLKPEIDIDWTKSSIKEYLWRPVQELRVGKKSTTQMNTKDIDGIYDVLNRFLSEKFGLHIPFPSIEELLQKAENI